MPILIDYVWKKKKIYGSFKDQRDEENIFFFSNTSKIFHKNILLIFCYYINPFYSFKNRRF